MRRKNINGLTIFQSRLLLKYPEVIHGVSTRLGGISQGLYRSLNLSFWVGDKASAVLENRRRFCHALDVSLDSLTVARQVHGCNVKIIRKSDRGKGSRNGSSAIQSTDAMLTKEKHISLLALSADCPLILCYDPIRKVIGFIHASWRGASEGIISKTIQRMREEFGSEPSKIIAVISPSIGPCCYEVKKDFIGVMRTRVSNVQRFIKQRKDKTYFNLWAFTKDQLKRSGLRPEHIESANPRREVGIPTPTYVGGLCTRCHSGLFYSWRRDGARTGRFGALISLSR